MVLVEIPARPEVYVLQGFVNAQMNRPICAEKSVWTLDLIPRTVEVVGPCALRVSRALVENVRAQG